METAVWAIFIKDVSDALVVAVESVGPSEVTSLLTFLVLQGLFVGAGARTACHVPRQRLRVSICVFASACLRLRLRLRLRVFVGSPATPMHHAPHHLRHNNGTCAPYTCTPLHVHPFTICSLGLGLGHKNPSPTRRTRNRCSAPIVGSTTPRPPSRPPPPPRAPCQPPPPPPRWRLGWAWAWIRQRRLAAPAAA